MDLSNICESLLTWYDNHKRDLPWRQDSTFYHVWLSEIMLQQTRVEAVKSYYIRFLKKVPTIRDLAFLEEATLLKLWEGLGYYNRARNLQKAAKKIETEYHGICPNTYEEIKKLPGVGNYTAGAISSIVYQIPKPAVDGNVLRVITRITKDTADITRTETKLKIEHTLEKMIPQKEPGKFNQALMELGATVCIPNGKPNCGQCPLKNMCCAYLENRIEEIPYKAPKKKRAKENKTVFLIFCGPFIACLKRQEAGLLKGLWEFPNVEGRICRKKIEALFQTWHLNIDTLSYLGDTTHIFTHIEWHLKVFVVITKTRNELFQWYDFKQLSEEIVLPTAFKKPLELLKKEKR